MKKREVELSKLQLQKQTIGVLLVQDQSAVMGGSTACPSQNKYEPCNITMQASCRCQTDPITGLGNVSLCNPQLSLNICQGDSKYTCLP